MDAHKVHTEHQALNKLDSYTADELTLFILDCVAYSDIAADGYDLDRHQPKQLLALTKHYGVELTGESQVPASDASTPHPLRAPKKAKAAPAKKKKAKRPLKTADESAPDDAGLFDGQNDDAGCAGGGTSADESQNELLGEATA